MRLHQGLGVLEDTGSQSYNRYVAGFLPEEEIADDGTERLSAGL